jgi:hypothetical protein
MGQRSLAHVSSEAVANAPKATRFEYLYPTRAGQQSLLPRFMQFCHYEYTFLSELAGLSGN